MSVISASMKLTRFLRRFNVLKSETMDTTCVSANRWSMTCPSLRSFETSALHWSGKKFVMDPSKLVTKDGTVIRKPTPRKVYIRLIFENEESVLTMTEANKIAKARGLTLVPVMRKDSSPSMPEYEMVRDVQLAGCTGSEDMSIKKYQTESSPDQKINKPERRVKTYVMNSNIEKHDFDFTLKKLCSALVKRGKIKCMIKEVPSAKSVSQLYDQIKTEIEKIVGDASYSVLRGKESVKLFEVILKNSKT